MLFSGVQQPSLVPRLSAGKPGDEAISSFLVLFNPLPTNDAYLRHELP